MISGYEKYAGNGDHRAFGASAGSKACITMFEIGISFSGCTPGRLGEDTAKPAVSFARMGAFSLASALVVTRTNTRPGRQVIRGRKLRHVRPNFRDQDSCGFTPNSRDRLQ